ncbi:MAG TPA: biliverdin-producing heme oxygenase [Kofleriaceae bacterium]
MLLRLHLETRAQHPEADFQWLELMSFDASHGRYIDQLVATYGFEAPVEAAYALTPHLCDVIQIRPRSRSGYIVEDLLALGLGPSTIARLPQCRQVAPFRDPAEALGWLYVLERATLLHEAVRDHIALRMRTVSAWRYLSAYAGVAGLRWQELGRALDAYAITPAASDYIVATARAAFRCQRDWFATEPAVIARAAWASESSGTRFVRD